MRLKMSFNSTLVYLKRGYPATRVVQKHGLPTEKSSFL
jgi:hypothetical protein